MENQHRKIKGYRELDQTEIDLMNEIKMKGVEMEALIQQVIIMNANLPDEYDEVIEAAESGRWCAIAKTNLQQGLMALTRAVAKPGFF
tara:strand:- start:135 stop:398 length:264 start_codon:yes stop_codon:yes gene_type:complete